MGKYKYGDIILVDFNPVKGSEISKIRPCIVVSRNEINAYSPLCIVVPVTSNVERVLPFHVVVKKTKKNGLSQNSKALTEQIKSIDKVGCTKKLGILEKSSLQELEQKISFVLNQR